MIDLDGRPPVHSGCEYKHISTLQVDQQYCTNRMSASYGPSGKEHDNFNFTNSCWTYVKCFFSTFLLIVTLMFFRSTTSGSGLSVPPRLPLRAAVPPPPYAHMHPPLDPRPSSTGFDLIHMSQHNSNIASHKLYLTVLNPHHRSCNCPYKKVCSHPSPFLYMLIYLIVLCPTA
jgi:hypothetical protein